MPRRELCSVGLNTTVNHCKRPSMDGPQTVSPPAAAAPEAKCGRSIQYIALSNVCSEGTGHSTVSSNYLLKHTELWLHTPGSSGDQQMLKSDALPFWLARSWSSAANKRANRYRTPRRPSQNHTKSNPRGNHPRSGPSNIPFAAKRAVKPHAS